MLYFNNESLRWERNPRKAARENINKQKERKAKEQEWQKLLKDLYPTEEDGKTDGFGGALPSNGFDVQG